MKKAVVIGAGPAGLAAAWKLSGKGLETVVLEKSSGPGGLSRTLIYKGYRFDIGGHRFYTCDAGVMSWWQGLLKDDFLKIPRLSRIYHGGRYFSYPISVPDVLSRIGIGGAGAVLASYLKARVFPLSEERTLEQWLVNRFGRRLYRLFFRDYSAKVWGSPCKGLSADVAGQRIRGLSVSSALRNALKREEAGARVKTLIREFYFPRLGAGMMYEACAAEVKASGGRFLFDSEVTRINHDGRRILAVSYKTPRGSLEIEAGDFLSSMPLTELVGRLCPAAPRDVLEMCRALRYRGLVMVYCIIKRRDVSLDNWIYVQSPELLVGRIQNFRNWSSAMLADEGASSLGLEYFCDEGDGLWQRDDRSLLSLAAQELERLGLCRREEVIDVFVERVPMAYPVYALGYRAPLDGIKTFVRGFSNLQCMGRYGLFHYNSMDHSILTGFAAAGNVMGENIDTWSVDPEGEGA
jgi:protoporphyrinogen oxidase